MAITGISDAVNLYNSSNCQSYYQKEMLNKIFLVAGSLVIFISNFAIEVFLIKIDYHQCFE
jgi:hypothetical protein